jgi:hypothetical protein
MVLKLALGSIAAVTTPSWAVESASQVTLYKDAQCGCCGAYADYLRDNGFTVAIVETPHLPMMYVRNGVPNAFQSCHLAMVDRYLAVGHIPVDVLKRMLTEKPAIAGITLPGMPAGSPGMGGSKTEPFKIYALGDRSPKFYAID